MKEVGAWVGEESGWWLFGEGFGNFWRYFSVIRVIIIY